LEAELDMEAIIGLSFGPVGDVMLVSTVDLRLAVSGNEDWIEICFTDGTCYAGTPTSDLAGEVYLNRARETANKNSRNLILLLILL